MTDYSPQTTAAPKVLLFSAYCPGRLGTGPRLLSDACEHYPRGRICCFALDRGNELDGPPSYMPVRFAHWDNLCPPRHVQAIPWRPLRVPFHGLWAIRRNRKLIAEAVEFGRQQKVELVWAVLGWMVINETAWHVADKLGVPMVSTVWDPPEYISRTGGHSGPVRRFLLGQFEKNLRRSRRCSVASEAMAEAYRNRYGVECVVLRMGVHPSLWRSPHTGLMRDDSIHIVFAGSLYATQEMRALIGGLRQASWKIQGRGVTLTIVSEGPFDIKLDHPSQIRLMGFRTPEDTQRIVESADIGYLPYWFRPDRRDAVRMSFPGKIGAYLAAGIPILYHGPSDATPTDFLRRYPVGVACNSLEPQDVIRSLERFGSGEVHRTAGLGGGQALREEFSLQVYVNRIGELLGVGPNGMRPVE